MEESERVRDRKYSRSTGSTKPGTTDTAAHSCGKMIAAHWLSARAPSPLSPGRGGAEEEEVEGGRRGVPRAGCWRDRGRRGGRGGGKGGEGWMARCLLPIPLSPRHSCVCLYEDLSNSPSTPSPPHGSFVVPLPVAPFYPPPLFRRRGPRVMIVFVHLEDEVSQLLSFLVSIPDATDASSQNALTWPAAREEGGGGRER